MPPRTRRRIHPGVTQPTGLRHDGNVSAPSEEARLEGFVPLTSTPAWPRPARKPIQHAQSSLPPSSPPPPTSSHERVHHEPVESNVPAADDPFGFIDAERRLKERAQKRNEIVVEEKGRVTLRPRAPDDENRPESVLAAMGIRVGKQRDIPRSEEGGEEGDVDDGRPAFATPPRASEDFDLELNMSTLDSSVKTPAGHTPDPRAVTPRQRRRKRKLSMTPSSRSPSIERESSAIPQTPSPNKSGRATRRPFAGVVPQDNTPRKITSKRLKGGKPARKTRKTDETLAEERLGGMTKALTELLPRRPTRKAVQSTAPVKATRTTRKKKDTRGARSRPKNAAVEREDEREFIGEREGESFVLHGEERERFEADREARREYFRRLDDYVMDEESVYVI